MRKRTRKSILLLMGGLALAGFLQSRHLQRQLHECRQASETLQQERLDALQALRQARQAATEPPPPADDRTATMAAHERDFYQRRMQRMEERIALLETAAITVRAGQEPTFPLAIERDVSADLSESASWLPLLSDPDYRETLRLRMLASIEATYQPLLEYFDFDSQSEATLLTLLLEKQWITLQYQAIDQQRELDPDLHASALEALAADLEDLDAIVYSFLGDDDFAFYEAYRATQPERQQVHRLQTTLSRHGLALTEAQEHDLIVLLHSANAAVDDTMLALLPPNDGEPSSPETALTAYRTAAAEQEQRILEGAASLLSAEQWEFFVPFMNAQQALQEAAVHQVIERAP